jgi:hypothetical protein
MRKGEIDRLIIFVSIILSVGNDLTFSVVVNVMLKRPKILLLEASAR